MWFFALIVVVLIGAVAVVASGRWGAMSTAYDDRPDMSVPARQALTSDDIETARFGVGLRGYRMDEVDTLLERVAREVAERDRRIADLERAVTPIMHGPEGAGFASRHTYDPADFDDTGYQLPILVGGNFPEDTTPEVSEAAEVQPAAEASAAEPATDASVSADASAAEPSAEPEAEQAALAEPQDDLPQAAAQPEAPQAAQPDAPQAAQPEAPQAAQPVAQQTTQADPQDDLPPAAHAEAPQAAEPDGASQSQAPAQAEHAPEPTQPAQPEASAQSSVAETAEQVVEPESPQQELAGGGASALEAPLPPVPPEPTLQPPSPAEQSWFQDTPATASEALPAQQPHVEQAGVERAETAQPVVRDGGAVQGQLWADPGAAAVQSANGQQSVPGEQQTGQLGVPGEQQTGQLGVSGEQQNGHVGEQAGQVGEPSGQAGEPGGQVGEQGEQVGEQAPRGRHSAAPDTSAFQRPN